MSKVKPQSTTNGRGQNTATGRNEGPLVTFPVEQEFYTAERSDISPQETDAYAELYAQEQAIASGDIGLPGVTPIPALTLKSLRYGCYLAFYYPVSSSPISILNGHYQGTIRVEKTISYTKGSGDLYFKRPVLLPTPIITASPNPANGIPVFSRKSYTYYLKVTKILHGYTFTNAFQLDFEMYRYNPVTQSFTKERKVTAKMAWTSAPSGYPDAGQYLKGEVKDSAGNVLGTLYMGWVDKYLRKATIEIDNVSGSEIPLESGTGVNWQNAGNKVGWKFNVVVSNNNVAEPSGASWSDAEMHAAMLARRDNNNLDGEWRYHILSVKRIDSTERGIMYDAYGTDSNNVPREGIGISTHWMIPNTATWGLVKGLRFGTAKAPFFRTAVHEIGHAMGLYHNTLDNGYMNTTDVIAGGGTTANPFPNNIKWDYAPNDQHRLRHFPDMIVRPGGTSFGISYGSVPISTDSADTTGMDMYDHSTVDDALQLEVKPVMEVFPMGAPVRLDFSLINTSPVAMEVPKNLSMKKANIYGYVTDPGGLQRSFSPIIRCVEEEATMTLQPGKKVSESLTLLRGKEGALFPGAGYYSIEVNVEWDIRGIPVSAKGTCSVMITAAVDEQHAKAAKAIFDTPDAHVVLVLGGDHLQEGIEAIQEALNNKILKPHYAYIEAKRVGKTFGRRKAQKDKAKALLQKDTVMNNKERQKSGDLIK